MKKIIALVLTAMMLLSLCSAFAEVPEGYPEIIEGLDFGGKTVYIYDWYSSGEREEEPDEDTQLTYDYRDWLQETYHCTIIEKQLTDWNNLMAAVTDMVMAKDDSQLCIIGLDGSFFAPAMDNGLLMPWTYGLDSGVYNDATTAYTTVNGITYGVYSGKNEPRQMVIFNKKVLEEANIDWNELYDLQAAHEWTWDKMEEYMDKVQVDKDNDGVYDVFALTGNGDDCTIAMVVSNGADFCGIDENGKLVPTIMNDAMYEALDRARQWREKYYEPNVNWDDYKAFWPQGNVAFFIGQSYEAFNGNDIIQECDDDWGALMLPMGPRMDDYTHCVSNNIFGIPNIYNEETSLNLQKIYTLYRMQTPGVDEDLGWVGNKYSLTDDRAVEESYAYLREVGVTMQWQHLGDRNACLGDIMWGLWNGTPYEICEAALPALKGRCDVYNGDKTQEEVDAEAAARAAEAEAAAAEVAE